MFTCPICNKTFIVGITGRVVIDHDHETGNFRGYLCNTCNASLGGLGDNIKELKNAITYLKNTYKK